MKQQKKFKYIQHFESLDSFIDTAITSKRAKGEHYSYSSEKEDSGWSGSESLQETLEIAENGYELDKISAELEAIESSEQYELRQSFQVSGGEVEIGRFMTGEPECMIEFDIIESNKFVNIIIGVTESAGISSEQILNRAVSVCSIVDYLENNKYRVRLSLAIANVNIDHAQGIDLTVVDVKDYKEPMSIARLAGILHTGFYRRLIFRYWEGLKHFKASVSEKTGGSESPTLAEKFNNIESAKKYAEDVQANIEKYTVRL